tara:strand:+ start:642 stop:977 length:336 start_codon:yes stop_codon:yes gene_type:complete
MYDQLGGGFHRYSVDERWLVPHFEKMLYDNALLIWVYLEAYQVTGKKLYQRITREVLDYVLREMTQPQGGAAPRRTPTAKERKANILYGSPKKWRRFWGKKTSGYSRAITG